jgi:hypothetical protein
MRVYPLALLCAVLASTHAFVKPQLSTTTTTIAAKFRHASILHSEKGVYEINRVMDDLAEQCGDFKKPVVALASQVEDMYLQAKQKDIISFNVMLKAWGRTCHAMERQKHVHHNGHQTTIHNTPSIAIYTPRDAAEHLTKCLMLAEEACQGNLDNCVVVPDETSYNIAIGAYTMFWLYKMVVLDDAFCRHLLHPSRILTQLHNHYLAFAILPFSSLPRRLGQKCRPRGDTSRRTTAGENDSQPPIGTFLHHL